MVDGIGSDVVLLGISGFRVWGVVEWDGELWVGVETTVEVTGCPDCGTRARGKGRRQVMVRDLPAGGRPVRSVWPKRRWSCPDPDCERGSWSETHPGIRPRAVLSERARRWAFTEVGRKGRTVASVAADLGVGWHTVMDAVQEFGEPLVDPLPGRGAGSGNGRTPVAASPSRLGGRLLRPRHRPAHRHHSWPFRHRNRGSSGFRGGDGGEGVPVGSACVEEDADPVVAQAAESEADAFDPLDEVVDCFCGSVRHPRLMPGDDLSMPASQGTAQGVDLRRAGVVLQVVGELSDELGGEAGVADGVDLADELGWHARRS